MQSAMSWFSGLDAALFACTMFWGHSIRKSARSNASSSTAFKRKTPLYIYIFLRFLLYWIVMWPVYRLGLPISSLFSLHKKYLQEKLVPQEYGTGHQGTTWFCWFCFSRCIGLVVPHTVYLSFTIVYGDLTNQPAQRKLLVLLVVILFSKSYSTFLGCLHPVHMIFNHENT